MHHENQKEHSHINHVNHANINYMMKKIYFYFFKQALYRAIKRANKEKKLTGYKMVVMKVGGWPSVYRRKDLKNLAARHKFKKGLSVDQVVSKALYVTN